MKTIQEMFFKLSLPIQAIALIALAIFSFGLIGPSMISSNSTIAVWFGIAVCVAAAYLLWELSAKLRELLK